MLLAHAFDRPNLLNWIRRFRKNRVRIYSCASALVVAATLVRLALHRELSTASPFTTYTLAVLCISLTGGFWPGMATLAVSLIAGSILFLPPAFSFTLAEGAEWPLLMFALFGSIQVSLVSGLIASILLHEEHQQLLFGELRHRSRNLFTVVQGVVSRTIVQSETLPEAKQAIEMRLAALARAHAMLADSGWTGALLERVISEELASFADQVSWSGCGLMLTTPAAQSFALIVHELATNAVKHGALSGPQGYVTITGDLLQDGKTQIFQFVWTESGGPVVEPPKRRGFGSSILSGMAKRFAKTVDISYPSEGLIYQLSVPLASIQAPLSESFSQRSSTQVDEPSVRDLREIKMEVTLAG